MNIILEEWNHDDDFNLGLLRSLVGSRRVDRLALRQMFYSDLAEKAKSDRKCGRKEENFLVKTFLNDSFHLQTFPKLLPRTMERIAI